MNTGSLNGFSINASAADVTVRSTVNGYAYAIADVMAHVYGRLVADTSARADATPRLLGRVNSPVTSTAQALQAVIPRVLRRSFLNVEARADAVVYSGLVRSVVQAAGEAAAVVIARVMRRSGVTSTAQASASVLARADRRAPIGVSAQALASPTGIVLVRSYFGEVMNTAARAVVDVVARVALRQPVDATASALAALRLSAILRNVGIYEAQATAVVDGSSQVYVPFDEFALEENTYLVSFEDNLFYVR